MLLSTYGLRLERAGCDFYASSMLIMFRFGLLDACACFAGWVTEIWMERWRGVARSGLSGGGHGQMSHSFVLHVLVLQYSFSMLSLACLLQASK